MSPPPGETGFTTLPSSCPPVHQGSLDEARRQRHSCVHCGCQGQHVPGKQAVRELYNTDVAKANSLLRPDGEKRGYVHLPSEYDHLEVANQIGLL